MTDRGVQESKALMFELIDCKLKQTQHIELPPVLKHLRTIIDNFSGIEAHYQHVGVKEDQNLAGELLVLIIGFEDRNKALDQLLVHWPEGIRYALTEVLSQRLDHDKDLTL